MFSVISAGIAPGFALLCYFYLKDEYDKEPLKDVFRVFIIGGILVFPIMFIQYVLDVEQVFQHPILKAFISVSFFEEFFKWFFLYFLIYKTTLIDEHYDGIVYGVSISLGFATVENILYLLSFGLEYAIGRAFLPVSSHALFGVIMGYYFGKAKMTNDQTTSRFIFFSILIPFLLHGLYDYILLSINFWVQIMIVFMIFLWCFALHKVKKAKHAQNEIHAHRHSIDL